MKILRILPGIFVIVILTITTGLTYTILQQSYRTNADKPQVQMARHISSQLKKGKSPESLVQQETVDITRGHSPFVVLYDNAGNPLQSDGMINNKMPTLPRRIFDVAKNNVQYNVTWQPEPGVKMAMVLVHTESAPVAYVAAGRSLFSTDQKTSNLKNVLLIGWSVCVAFVLVISLVRFQKGAPMNKIIPLPLSAKPFF